MNELEIIQLAQEIINHNRNARYDDVIDEVMGYSGLCDKSHEYEDLECKVFVTIQELFHS